MATTGRHDIVAVAEAYHGWTYATDAVSTRQADNPNALETRPSWIHTVPSPTPTVALPRAGRRELRAEAVASSKTLPPRDIRLPRSSANRSTATPFGDGTARRLPAGRCMAVCHGRVGDADEVQVGYGPNRPLVLELSAAGRGARHRHRRQGDGQRPALGAVITTRAIAEKYRTQGYFFSSAGGSPVSCGRPDRFDPPGTRRPCKPR